MKILVIAEHDNLKIKDATLKTISAALTIAKEIHVLVMGFQCEAVATACQSIVEVKKVIYVDEPEYQHFLAENISKVATELAKEYTHILAPATTFGKDFLPRVAAVLDVAQISDVIKIIDAETFNRPIYAGNANATVRSNDAIKVLTIRTTAFPAASYGDTTAPMEKLTFTPEKNQTVFIRQEINQSTRPELSSAKVVISGGRGLQNGENFKLLEKLADSLQGAIGASRAAVDAGFVPNDYQVGQTGKVVAPELYIAIGISGAIQHLAGMKDSKIIVAINKDADAPIFKVADYGLVGDLFQIIPELTELLQQRK